jgi:aryl-alcohol dehydrogenase-like predicted oxidoreductase
MRYVTIPNTSLSVSAICLGSATFGSDIPYDEAISILDAFAGRGGNFIDSARVYADWLPGGHGASETTIGKWLKGRKREEFVIGTKGGHPDLRTMQTGRLTPRDVTADLEESLRCLQTDHIDLYWLHRDDPSIPVADILEMMTSLVARGSIRYFGCSNWRAPRIAQAIEIAAEKGITGFVADQMLWALAQINPGAIGDETLVQMSPELFDLHHRSGLAAIPYSSQAKGFFTKLARDGNAISGGLRKKFWNTGNVRRMKVVSSVAAEYSVPVSAVPLAWLASQTFITVPIIGPRNTGQLTESLAAADIVLSPELVKELS